MFRVSSVKALVVVFKKLRNDDALWKISARFLFLFFCFCKVCQHKTKIDVKTTYWGKITDKTKYTKSRKLKGHGINPNKRVSYNEKNNCKLTILGEKMQSKNIDNYISRKDGVHDKEWQFDKNDEWFTRRGLVTLFMQINASSKNTCNWNFAYSQKRNCN